MKEKSLFTERLFFRGNSLVPNSFIFTFNISRYVALSRISIAKRILNGMSLKVANLQWLQTNPMSADKLRNLRVYRKKEFRDYVGNCKV